MLINRRFITNLDRWSILALIGTASESQALGLRDAIYKHLAFENFIGVTFPVRRLVQIQPQGANKTM
jgi:hypothetical protein